MGFCCQCNEFSHFMLLACNFFMNRGLEADSPRLYPWAAQYSNYVHAEGGDQIEVAVQVARIFG